MLQSGNVEGGTTEASETKSTLLVIRERVANFYVERVLLSQLITVVFGFSFAIRKLSQYSSIWERAFLSQIKVK